MLGVALKGVLVQTATLNHQWTARIVMGLYPDNKINVQDVQRRQIGSTLPAEAATQE